MSQRVRRTRADRSRMHLISGRIRAERMADPLRRGIFLVPATITSLGLLSGFYSMVSAVSGHFELAAVMIILAFFCDGLDGRIARISKTSSQFGVEYDSLCDVVAFGAAPAMLSYEWALKTIGSFGIAVSGLFLLCGALRLARFNVQTATLDKRRFVGLPIPGAALLIATSALAYSYFEFESPRALCLVMVPVTLTLAWLMISRVPYPSFKSMQLDKRARVELVIAIVGAVAALFAMPQLTAFMLGAAYVLSGPYLMLRGEHLSAKFSVLHAVPAEKAES